MAAKREIPVAPVFFAHVPAHSVPAQMGSGIQIPFPHIDAASGEGIQQIGKM
jgi:hypothetical protein